MLADEYEAFLFDLDGVVFVDDEPVTGVVEAIRRLRRRGKDIQFVTNNSQYTREAFAEKLTDLGIAAGAEDVTSAAWVTAAHLRDRGFDQVYCIGVDGFRSELDRQGIGLGERGAEAVAVGFDPGVTYADLRTATQLVHGQDLPLVATSGDASYPVADGIAPGTGAIVRAIEAASGTEATVVGKPNPPLFERALRAVSKRPVAMVGDTLASDVAGAHGAGIDGILVSLHCRRDDEADAEVEPEARVETPMGLVEPE